MKKRADVLLYEKNLFSTREKAKANIMAGNVYVKGLKVVKPGENFPIDTIFEIKKRLHPYVSRGGMKLAGAIEKWQIDFSNKIVMDVGASTGGFTDCSLQHGAKKVIAIDVGTNQLDYKLRIDPRVDVYEKTNFRNLKDDELVELVDIVVMDVSFISIKLLLANIYKRLKNEGIGIFLIKPQFEAPIDIPRKNGIIRNPDIHQMVIKDIQETTKKMGFKNLKIMPSPILGQKGNREFLLLVKKAIS